MDKDMRIMLAVDLFGKALRINGVSPRIKGMTGDLPTIFVELSGHVANITFRIFDHGWACSESGEKMALGLDDTDDYFIACYKTISSRLDEIQNDAVEYLRKKEEQAGEGKRHETI